MSIEIVMDDKAIATNDTAAIKQGIADMTQFAHSLVVDNESAFKSITSVYRTARDWKKIIEEKRKEAVEPYRKQQILINDKAKELTDPLTKVEQITKLKAEEYQKHLEAMKKLEEENARAAADLLDVPQEQIYVAPLAQSIRGEGAMAYTVMEKRFKLIDISKVPVKYLELNEALVKQDIKLGIDVIPGVEIYEAQVTKLRSR